MSRQANGKERVDTDLNFRTFPLPNPLPEGEGIIRLFKILIISLLLLTTPAHASDKVLDINIIKSKSGIEAWLVQDKTVPVVSISFSFKGGLMLDPEDKPGVGRLVSILLDEGASDMDSHTFQSKLTDNAIDMKFTAGRDEFYGHIKTLKKTQDIAFDLLKLALTQPRFDDDAIERMKEANRAQIKSDLTNPEWLIARSFNGVLFEGHPYSRPGHGHLAAMKRITRDDLVNFTKNQFNRNSLKIAIAGDISEKDAQKMLDDIFGTLPETSDIPDSKAATLQQTGKTVLLKHDAPQTFISVGTESISNHDPDWQALVVMNYILGGGSFESRLMKEIREKRGLTYGVYSRPTVLDHASLLHVSLSAGNDKAKQALDLIKQEWKKMAEKGVTERELEDAKSYLTGSLLLQLTSTKAIANTMNGLQRDGFDAEYVNHQNDKVRAVTQEDIQRVATKLLKTDQLTTVLVGNPTGITPNITLDKPPGMEE